MLQQLDDREYRIGELAEEFDISLRTLRFYEDKGLISPTRIGNKRIYSRIDRGRLKMILLGKRLGFPLSDVAEMLELYDPANGNLNQLTVALDKGAEQMNKLQAERQKIDAAIGELEETLQTCRALLHAKSA